MLVKFEGKSTKKDVYKRQEQLGLPSNLTNANVISKRFSKMRGEFPNWSFDDVKDPVARLKEVYKRQLPSSSE